MILLYVFSPVKVDAGDRNFHKKKVAFTIDDLPFSLNYIPWAEKRKHVQNFLEVLNKYSVESTAFIIGSNVTDENWKIITDFMDYGHTIGNHTYYHFGPNGVSARTYLENILLCDTVLSIIKYSYKTDTVPKLGIDIHQKLIFDISTNFERHKLWRFENNDYTYFRYPYLKRGNTRMKRDSILSFLYETKHIIAPVTITSHDWRFSDDFFEAYKSKDKEMMDIIGERYVHHVIEQINHSYKHSRRELGLPIDHIFLMHMNLLNVFYFDKILKWFEENNWEFITLEEAMTNRFYLWDDSYSGTEGIPWLYRAKKLIAPIPF